MYLSDGRRELVEPIELALLIQGRGEGNYIDAMRSNVSRSIFFK